MITCVSPSFLDLLREQRAQLLAPLSRNATGAPIGDDSLLVQRTKISARGDIARLQLESKPERFDDAASHFKLKRVVAEQSQMSRTAARRDSRRYGNHSSLRRILGERVEVRSSRSFERRDIIVSFVAMSPSPSITTSTSFALVLMVRFE
jgi:hypothetical protein